MVALRDKETRINDHLDASTLLDRLASHTTVSIHVALLIPEHILCVCSLHSALCYNSKVLRMMEEVKIGLSLSATSWKHAGLRQHQNVCSIKQQNMVTFAPTIPTCNYFLHISRMPAQTSMALAPEMKVIWWKQHQMTRSQGNGELMYKPLYTTSWRGKDNIPSMLWSYCAQ